MLDQNISNLYGLIWGQCNPEFKEGIIGLDHYGVKLNEYDCLWLFWHLNLSTSGSNRSQYDYLSYVRDIRSQLTIHQQDSKSTEVFSKRLDYLLMNLKLVGGYMHPEELETK